MPSTSAPEFIRVQGFIVITRDQRWGWGATPEDARKAAKKAGAESVARKNRAMYALPEGAINAWVDQMGMIHWDWDPKYLQDVGDRTATGTWVETSE